MLKSKPGQILSILRFGGDLEGFFVKPASAPCSPLDDGLVPGSRRVKKPFRTLPQLSGSYEGKPNTSQAWEPSDTGIMSEQTRMQGTKQIHVQLVQTPLGSSASFIVFHRAVLEPSQGPGRASPCRWLCFLQTHRGIWPQR